MPTTDRDIQALTYLARRLRDETHGCRAWDEAGTFAVLKQELAGQNLLIATQRVIGHATDPDAKTPGAIKRPYVPAVEKPKEPHVVRGPRDWCHICGELETHVKHSRDHGFLSVEQARRIPAGTRPKPEKESA